MSGLTEASTLIRLARVRATLYRAAVDVPMLTSFGALGERPALFVEVTDDDGATGWGEIWCNFPPLVAEHRLEFVRTVVAPLIVQRTFDEPADVGKFLDRALGIQAVQAGEEGTLASVSAAIDQAMWDLIARRVGQPLWRILGGRGTIRVYASGIDPTRAIETIRTHLKSGHTAFKLKLGFYDSLDIDAVFRVYDEFGDAIELMVDANQAWSLRHALEVANAIAETRPLWLEEPIRATEPQRIWRELAERSPVPLAAGENIRSGDAFRELAASGFVRHIQPDVGKWGGVSGCVGMGRWAVAQGLAFSPHWAGGGIGLSHSLHVLAAIGGDGYAEMDVTANPLRDWLVTVNVRDGFITLPDEPGIGVDLDLESLARYRVESAGS
jgi:D-galactarolactone cycloisomerase